MTRGVQYWDKNTHRGSRNRTESPAINTHTSDIKIKRETASFIIRSNICNTPGLKLTQKSLVIKKWEEQVQRHRGRSTVSLEEESGAEWTEGERLKRESRR